MYQDKKVIHIVACGMNGEIGVDNSLLWNIPEDLRFFKESTIGHVVLMGRNTFEGLPKPLDKRITLVVSRSDYDDEDKQFALVWGLDDSVSYSNILNNDKFFIVGGSQLYSSTLNIVDELWMTQVGREYPEADAFYTKPQWLFDTKPYYSKQEIVVDKLSGKRLTIEFLKFNKQGESK